MLRRTWGEFNDFTSKAKRLMSPTTSDDGTNSGQPRDGVGFLQLFDGLSEDVDCALASQTGLGSAAMPSVKSC